MLGSGIIGVLKNTQISKQGSFGQTAGEGHTISSSYPDEEEETKSHKNDPNDSLT